jgi:hypothetical protein
MQIRVIACPPCSQRRFRPTRLPGTDDRRQLASGDEECVYFQEPTNVLHQLIKRGLAAVLGVEWVGITVASPKWKLAGSWCNVNPDEKAIRPIILVHPRRPAPFPHTT